MSEKELMEPYGSAVIEISSVCNAKCKWCTTGIKNREKICDEAEFITAEKLEQGIKYLLDNHIITENAEFELYNWGEPFLNPHLNDLLKTIYNMGMKYHLSSNGSRVVLLDAESVKNMTFLMFSVSGFSNTTYLHGFDIEQIKKNICIMVNHLSEVKYTGKIIVNFHVYQFNLSEINAAAEYFQSMPFANIEFRANFAYLADFKLANTFVHPLTGGGVPETWHEAAQELITFFYRDIISHRPATYVCHQQEQLVLDQRLNVVPCCLLYSEDSIGSLFEFTLESLLEARENVKKCSECASNRLDYLVHHMPSANFLVDKHFMIQKKAKFYYNVGNGFNEEDCITWPVTKNTDGVMQCEVCLPSEVCLIRFDPIENSGCILKNLQVFADAKAHYEVVDGIIFNDYVFLTNSDPQIYIDFEKPVGSLRLSVEYICELAR